MSKRSSVRAAFVAAAAVLVAGLGLVGYNAYAAETPAKVIPLGSAPRATVKVPTYSADLYAGYGFDLLVGNPGIGDPAHPSRLAYEAHYLNDGPTEVPRAFQPGGGTGYYVKIRVAPGSAVRFMGYRLSRTDPEVHACPGANTCQIPRTAAFPSNSGFTPVFYYEASSDACVGAVIEIYADINDPGPQPNATEVTINPKKSRGGGVKCAS